MHTKCPGRCDRQLDCTDGSDEYNCSMFFCCSNLYNDILNGSLQHYSSIYRDRYRK